MRSLATENVRINFERLWSRWFEGPRSRDILGLLLLSGVFFASIIYTPADRSGFTICLFKNFTGIDCPGCGLTRSFCALAKGQIWRAFQFHKLGPFLFLGFIVLWIRCLLAALGIASVSARIDSLWRRPATASIALAAFVAYWLIRAIYFLATHRTI